MVKKLYVAVRHSELKVHIEGCVTGYSPLAGGVITLACKDDKFIIGVLRLIESGVPATALASYPCGPSGPLGEVINLVPTPCRGIPLGGALKAYCLNLNACNQLIRKVLEAKARRLRLAKTNSIWLLEAEIQPKGYLNLRALDEINRKSLETYIIEPVKIPPIIID